eukprot:1193335-Prorocentrum_minimum.AAC.3
MVCATWQILGRMRWHNSESKKRSVLKSIFIRTDPLRNVVYRLRFSDLRLIDNCTKANRREAIEVP